MTYRLAALAIGLILGAYWARVARMARKARRRTGRAANFLPPEPLGRLLRTIWIPVVMIWVAHPFLTAAGWPAWFLLRPFYRSAGLAWLAGGIVFTCFLATRRCWKRMGKSWRMGIDPLEKTSLILDGPWARVRHPIYALSQAMMLATVAAIASPVMIGAGLLHLLLLQWEARREEAHLRNVHGRPYAEYCGRVGRFIPAIKFPRSPDQNVAM